MDKRILEAFKAQRYSLVLELTSKEEDFETVLYRYKAFARLSKGKEALSLLIKYRDDFFKLDPIGTIKTTLTLRFSFSQFDEAYLDAENFLTYPYVSQEVEELLKEMNSMIRKAERATYEVKKVKKIEINETMNEIDLLDNLSKIEVKMIPTYLDSLRKLVSSLGKDEARTYALLLLVAGEDAKEIKFLKNGSEFSLIPKDLEPPFSSKEHLAFLEELTRVSKDPSLNEVALKLYSEATLGAYPETLLEKDKISEYALAFKEIAAKYLSLEENLDSNPQIRTRITSFLKSLAA